MEFEQLSCRSPPTSEEYTLHDMFSETSHCLFGFLGQQLNEEEEDHDNCEGDSPDMSGKSERHKLSERVRRDKTRNLLRELEKVVPNCSSYKRNPNINLILEKTLEYLQSCEAKEKRPDPKSARDVVTFLVAQSLTHPYDDTARRRYLFAFDYAPMGLVISSIDGRVLGANKSFQRWFKFPNGMDGSTIFSLTCAPDLAKTLKAASNLVAGEAPVIALSKQCVRGDGVLSERLYVEMSLIRRQGRPIAFLCEVRPADPRAFGRF